MPRVRSAATKSPFFVAKLKVQVLPTLIAFRDGVAMGRQVGFEGLDMIGATSATAGVSAGSAAGAGIADARSVDFTTASLYQALKAGAAFGDDAAMRADSDSDGEGGSGGGDGDGSSGGGSAAAKLAAARRRMIEALDAET